MTTSFGLIQGHLQVCWLVQQLMKKRKLNLNITREEYSALDMLRKDKEIVVLPPDKGRSTVVLNKVDYDKKVMTLLEDRDTYEIIAKDPMSKIRTRSCGLLHGLRSEGMLSKEQYFSIYMASEAPRLFMACRKFTSQVFLFTLL